MARRIREPGEFARQVEEHPQLPAGSCERVSGYGVMGLPFRSGHVLGLRRWTASSVGDGYTSIWHRDPAGSWTFYQSAPAEIACTRYFGADVERVQTGPIALDWQDMRRLHIHTPDGAVEWTIELESAPITRMMSIAGAALPVRAWRSRPVLAAMGRVASWSLGVGTVRLIRHDLEWATFRRESAANLVRDLEPRRRRRPATRVARRVGRTGPPERLLHPTARHLRDRTLLRNPCPQ